MDPLMRGLNGVILVFGLGLFVVSVGYLLWLTHSRRSATDDRQAEDDTAVSSTDGGTVVSDTGGFVFGDERHDRDDTDTTDGDGDG